MPNLECKCVDITSNGATIVSGWSDGKVRLFTHARTRIHSRAHSHDQVRAFFPESGKIKFVINEAHSEGCTALALCNDDESYPPWWVLPLCWGFLYKIQLIRSI